MIIPILSIAIGLVQLILENILIRQSLCCSIFPVQTVKKILHNITRLILNVTLILRDDNFLEYVRFYIDIRFILIFYIFANMSSVIYFDNLFIFTFLRKLCSVVSFRVIIYEALTKIHSCAYLDMYRYNRWFHGFQLVCFD